MVPSFPPPLAQMAPQLARASPTETARLVSSHFPELMGPMIRFLDAAPSVQFPFLRSLLARGDALDPAILSHYIRLLCEYAPLDVLPFLLSRDGYSLEAALRHCQEFRVRGALMYLLERMGNIDEAMRLANDAVQQVRWTRERGRGRGIAWALCGGGGLEASLGADHLLGPPTCSTVRVFAFGRRATQPWSALSWTGGWTPPFRPSRHRRTRPLGRCGRLGAGRVRLASAARQRRLASRLPRP